MNKKEMILGSLKQLSFKGAVRGLVLLLPMLLAAFFGKNEWIIPFGQGGIFYAILPLAPRLSGRVITMFVSLAPGLGYYLIGANSTPSLFLVIVYALVAGMTIGLLTGWKYVGMAAAALFVPIYTAGLNTGSPEAAAASFTGFSLIILYGGLVSLLPYWPTVAHKPPSKDVNEAERVVFGTRLGLGMGISLAIAEAFQFSKLGWAPSAAGSVIRPDSDSRSTASVRMAGVVIGAIIASCVLALTHSINAAVLAVVLLGILNGALGMTPLSTIPILYNAVILILYSYTANPSGGLVIERVGYNLLGVLAALAVVYYPLPHLTKRIHAAVTKSETQNTK